MGQEKESSVHFGTSTITIRERPIKMLRLQIPDWEENEGLYHQRFEDFMDELTRNGIEIYEQNENAADYLSSRITTKSLLYLRYKAKCKYVR